MSLRTANSGTCERDSSPSPRLGSSVPASCSLAASVWLLARACLPCLCLIRLSHFDERENTCTFASAHCRAGGVLLIGIFTGPSYLRNSPPQQSCQRRLSVAQSVSSQATHCTAYTCTRPLVRSHPVAVVAAAKGHPSSTQSRTCTVIGYTNPTHQTHSVHLAGVGRAGR